MSWSKPEKKKTWPGIDDKCMKMTRKQQSPQRFIFSWLRNQFRKVADVIFQERSAAFNSFRSEQKENKVAPRRRHYQQYGPQTIILLKDFICQRFYNALRKTVMGWNVECVVFLFVFNDRWLFLFRKAKMEKVPHRRRECEEYDPVSEICARV